MIYLLPLALHNKNKDHRHNSVHKSSIQLFSRPVGLLFLYQSSIMLVDSLFILFYVVVLRLISKLNEQLTSGWPDWYIYPFLPIFFNTKPNMRDKVMLFRGLLFLENPISQHLRGCCLAPLWAKCWTTELFGPALTGSSLVPIFWQESMGQVRLQRQRIWPKVFLMLREQIEIQAVVFLVLVQHAKFLPYAVGSIILLPSL